MEGRRRRFYFHREPLSCPNGLGVLLRAKQTLPSPSIFPKNFAVSLFPSLSSLEAWEGEEGRMGHSCKCDPCDRRPKRRRGRRCHHPMHACSSSKGHRGRRRRTGGGEGDLSVFAACASGCVR